VAVGAMTFLIRLGLHVHIHLAATFSRASTQTLTRIFVKGYCVHQHLQLICTSGRIRTLIHCLGFHARRHFS